MEDTRRRFLVIGLTAGLVLALALPAVAAGRHAKANGSVVWTSASGRAGITTHFSLHDRDGDDVRGSFVSMTIPLAGGGVEWREISVECVTIDGDTARWGGHITATNNPTLLGDPIIGWVRDGGTPGAAGDGMGTWANPGKPLCSHTFTGGGTVTAGNLTVMP